MYSNPVYHSDPALAELKKRNATHLSLMILCPFHFDHYFSLLDMIRSGITVERVVLNIPNRKIVAFEIPWGCNMMDVDSFLQELQARRIPYHTPVAGERIYEVKSPNGVVAGIDVLCAFDGLDTPDTNLACIEADYFDTGFTTPFEVICAIGVLEWAGAFQDETDPQERQRAFLRKARGELAAGGSLVLGIENRRGLKYLLGCPDDHLGVPHIGCLPAALARPRWQAASGQALQSFTYSYAELQAMLREAGFATIEFLVLSPTTSCRRKSWRWLRPAGRSTRGWRRRRSRMSTTATTALPSRRRRRKPWWPATAPRRRGHRPPFRAQLFRPGGLSRHNP